MTFAALRSFDESTADALLIALALSPGVDPAKPVKVSSVPRSGRHGRHAVVWTQDGRERVAEGFTLRTALERAVAQSRGECASPEVGRAKTFAEVAR